MALKKTAVTVQTTILVQTGRVGMQAVSAGLLVRWGFHFAGKCRKRSRKQLSAPRVETHAGLTEETPMVGFF